MKKNKKIKSSNITGVLYQELPAEVLSIAGESDTSSNVQDFISNSLPLSDSRFVSEVLKKTNVNIELKHHELKKVKLRPKKTELSQKDRRALNLYRLPKTGIKYKDAAPMNRLWEGYMTKFLNLDQLKGKSWYNPKTGNLWESVSFTLLKADFHGALVKVLQSRCPSYVGHEGIIIFDTKYTFTIIGKDDTTRTVPKLSCIFEISVKQYKFKIFGKYFCIRTAERSTKKIKSSFIPTL
ncbi:ribonuclease P protein subunit p29 [Planococcus citri]|uniref:ribonuclease P protein subunit p29 n=1 Tax=Planococcus citri TaxID=170843 RepID=UPI0031F80049